jgi:hypothetical protein
MSANGERSEYLDKTPREVYAEKERIHVQDGVRDLEKTDR